MYLNRIIKKLWHVIVTDTVGYFYGKTAQDTCNVKPYSFSTIPWLPSTHVVTWCLNPLVLQCHLCHNAILHLHVSVEAGMSNICVHVIRYYRHFRKRSWCFWTKYLMCSMKRVNIVPCESGFVRCKLL